MAARGIWKNPTITVEATSYTGEITAATLTPDTSIQTQKTLNPAVVLQDVDTPTWTFDVTLVQGTFSDLLTDATPGDVLDVVMQESPGTGKRTATFSVLAIATPFGGEQGSFPTATVSLPVVDQPVFDVSS